MPSKPKTKVNRSSKKRASSFLSHKLIKWFLIAIPVVVVAGLFVAWPRQPSPQGTMAQLNSAIAKRDYEKVSSYIDTYEIAGSMVGDYLKAMRTLDLRKAKSADREDFINEVYDRVEARRGMVIGAISDKIRNDVIRPGSQGGKSRLILKTYREFPETLDELDLSTLKKRDYRFCSLSIVNSSTNREYRFTGRRYLDSKTGWKIMKIEEAEDFTSNEYGAEVIRAIVSSFNPIIAEETRRARRVNPF